MDPSRLNPDELQQLLTQEKQKAMLNEMVAKVTKECWDKCITGSPGSKFSSSESSCLSNCARRYMDMSMTIMKRFQSMQ
ncbi:mitochondrial import inner membrane translocase subunit TIM8-like [Malania oleifera]|uniref:mitochondrial import inner membrane translocase subunit TIM8-like n=1 Tax=Malania oleifera TaxID=397392 RepID=UPI0025AE3E51|nr:mitochondrial import inner membrane translocase subunit TIM8-like [Malania oleifera]